MGRPEYLRQCVMMSLRRLGVARIDLWQLHRIDPSVPRDEQYSAIAAMRKGAYDYLLKPFEKEQLLATVKRALEYRRLVQQNSIYRHNLEQLVAARTDMLNHAMADLERSYDITLEALGDALDLKDAETEGHSKRVTAYTIALARAMEVDGTEIRTVARGAYLHDIGKMAIPDSILLKPGKLDLNEQAMMREHCLRELGRYKTPCEFRFVSELPRGPSGKVQRLKLVTPSG